MERGLGEPFTLAEDRDPSHGPRGQNIVKAWKAKHQLNHYFYCPGSLDWVPIENAWKYTESTVRNRMCPTHHDLVEACQEGWKTLDQLMINAWVDSIPDRLNDTLKLEGKMTGH